MIVYHNSNHSYEKPMHEDIVKNRSNHVNGVLGLWFSMSDSWLEGFGKNTYEIIINENDISKISTGDLFNWEKKANKLYDNELDKENYYLSLREELLKKGIKGLLFKEMNGKSEMGIILDLKIIQSFNLKTKTKKLIP